MIYMIFRYGELSLKQSEVRIYLHDFTLLQSGKRRGWWRKFTLLVSLPSLFYRYVGFTRHAHLAEAAAVPFIVISLFDILAGSNQVLTAGFLVMAGRCKRPNRAAINAFAT